MWSRTLVHDNMNDNMPVRIQPSIHRVFNRVVLVDPLKFINGIEEYKNLSEFESAVSW